MFSMACRKNQTKDPTPATIQWSKVAVKGEGLISAFYGDINEQMIVGTNLNLLKTSDKGATWKTVARNIDQVREFVVSGDSLIAISLGKDLFSFDKGDSWQLLSYDRMLDLDKIQVLEVVTTNNNIYKYIQNADGENALPYDVLMSSDNRVSWKNVFPYKHYITDIYVDNSDKVYLGIWGATWNGQSFVSTNPPDDAIIYYGQTK